KRIVFGNLRVEQNLTVGGDLVVFGDLDVRGFHTDTCMEIGTITVGGDFTCNQHILTEGFLSVGGKISAPLVFFSFNQGFAKVLNGCDAQLLIESDHGGTRIFGPVNAEFVIRDELVV